ncbi:phosphotransferase [Cellulomonas sp. DKR-3]|uniref:Phosphotransferase n=1 Tax=Cellulomonas fulva TaxID=2835530 RepID=A0ABS5TW17_9CELL|nr:phosphotransferase [Cellulomonas fulva]MBT0993345.1 phosphotransferase [Cellulomonas fulva]
MPVTLTSEVPLESLRTLVAPVGELREAIRLEGGFFATTYRVTLTDGTRVVVKTAPAATDRLLTHEHDLLRTEALVYGLGGARPDLLMPRLLHTDLTRAVVPGDVVVASHLDGVPWVDAGFGPPDEDARTRRAQSDLGALVGRLGTVTGEAFGYPQSPALQAGTWRAAFTAMVGTLLADARHWGVDVPDERIRAALARHADALDTVTAPRLVHTDLWPGNVFVEPATGEVVGIIDTERALWGDPVLDLVGADPMWDGLPDAFAAHHDLTAPHVPTRLALGHLWLSLVMTVEPAPRAYPPSDWLTGYAAANRRNLARALDELA